VLKTSTRTRRQSELLALAAALALLSTSGCTANQSTSRTDLAVTVQVDVCQDSTCFPAGVPGASVKLDMSGTSYSGATDSNGVAHLAVTQQGAGVLDVTWGTVDKAIDVAIQGPSMSIEVRFDTAAKLG
jgi:hypothetical protein